MNELPPTPKGRHHEIRARALRDFAGLTSDEQPLDPFALAKYAKLLVISLDHIKELSKDSRDRLLGDAKDEWSGGAASQKLPNGEKLIVLNPTHSRTRQNATLMEEVCHVFLGHKPSRLSIERKNKDGKIVARDYNYSIEEEAYSTGAAALVPYSAIKRMVSRGLTVQQIARHFMVSKALVEYRIKISRLWEAYKNNVLRGNE